MNEAEVESEHLASLSGEGLYSYIANSHHSKPFHDSVEKTIKATIGDFKNPFMDRADLAKIDGWFNHRWKHPGHDPLDITKSIITDPLGRGKLDAGHFLTDFFTKAGIPLPGMSKHYLGNGMAETLRSFGVNNPVKWLNMNGFDHLFGGMSMLESGHDMSQSLSTEQIDFTWETAFDTFGEGTLEIAFGLQTFNPVLLASGVTEYAAGSIMLYKDISRDNAPVYEKIIDNLPGQEQLVPALGLYMLLASLKNYVAYSSGKINIREFRNQTITDVSVSLGTFAVTKSLITTFSIGTVTGGMLLPLLIDGGTSLLLRQIFILAFPKNKILITENELWEQSPFQYDSPWGHTPFQNNNVWQDNIFDNGNIWQKNLLTKGN